MKRHEILKAAWDVVGHLEGWDRPYPEKEFTDAVVRKAQGCGPLEFSELMNILEGEVERLETPRGCE